MNTIIVHGSYGKPFENWFPWLENELYKKNMKNLFVRIGLSLTILMSMM